MHPPDLWISACPVFSVHRPLFIFLTFESLNTMPALMTYGFLSPARPLTETQDSYSNSLLGIVPWKSQRHLKLSSPKPNSWSLPYDSKWQLHSSIWSEWKPWNHLWLLPPTLTCNPPLLSPLSKIIYNPTTSHYLHWHHFLLKLLQ